MSDLTPFAEMPATPEGLIASLRRQLAMRYPEAVRAGEHVIESTAERAVRQLWDSRVKTFVPVLALRDAQAMLREQGATPRQLRSSGVSGSSTQARTPRPRVPPRDRLSLSRDSMLLDEADALEL